jgi:hypothetical protein
VRFAFWRHFKKLYGVLLLRFRYVDRNRKLVVKGAGTAKLGFDRERQEGSAAFITACNARNCGAHCVSNVQTLWFIFNFFISSVMHPVGYGPMRKVTKTKHRQNQSKGTPSTRPASPAYSTYSLRFLRSPSHQKQATKP